MESSIVATTAGRSVQEAFQDRNGLLSLVGIGTDGSMLGKRAAGQITRTFFVRRCKDGSMHVIYSVEPRPIQYVRYWALALSKDNSYNTSATGLARERLTMKSCTYYLVYE